MFVVGSRELSSKYDRMWSKSLKVCIQALVKGLYVCDKNMEFRTPQKDRVVVTAPGTLLVFMLGIFFAKYGLVESDPKKVAYVLIGTLGTIYLV